MSFLDFQDAPEVPEDDVRMAAWRNAWYKAGFTHGIQAALANVQGLMDTPGVRFTKKHVPDLERLLLKKAHFLMAQILEGEFKCPGFVRMNQQAKSLEWFQPLTQGEAWELMCMAMELNKELKKNEER